MDSDPVRIQVRSPLALLAVVPHLLGFHPASSLVVVTMSGPHGPITTVFRYDLPEPPDTYLATQIAGHTAAVLHRGKLATVIVIGYGPGTLVTPVIDVIRAVLPREGIRVQDLLRVHEGRFWSYLCADPVCCPADGTPVSGTDPAAVALTVAGLGAAPSRAAIAATIAPVDGTDAAAMTEATDRAERAEAETQVYSGPDAVRAIGLDLVRSAIITYRDGGAITDHFQLARIALALITLEVRDDAWARMLPEHHDAHIRFWTDLTRHAQPGYVAAPASLLAFTAWQAGDGALGNLAIDRALADDPDYSMAHLIRAALTEGLPPSAAVLSMTPDEVAASYQAQRRSHQAPQPRARAGTPSGPRSSHPCDRRLTMTHDNPQLDKIRKLLAKAEADGVTPAEAEALTGKAAELMARYGIDRALLAATQPETDQPTDRIITVPNPWAAVHAHMLCGIAAAMRCKCVLLGTTKGSRVHVFGYASDIERAEVLYTSVLLQMRHGLNRAAVPEWTSSPRAWRRSWLLGFSTAVIARVRVAEKRAADHAVAEPVAAASQSTALVLASRQQVIARRAQAAYPVTRKSRVTYSGSGYRDGYTKGTQADIGGTRLTPKSRRSLR